MKAIENNPKISRRELSEIIEGISEDGIKYHLNKLKIIGKLKRVGSDKGGYWQIIQDK